MIAQQINILANGNHSAYGFSCFGYIGSSHNRLRCGHQLKGNVAGRGSIGVGSELVFNGLIKMAVRQVIETGHGRCRLGMFHLYHFGEHLEAQ